MPSRGDRCATCVMGGGGGAPASSGFFSPDGQMKSGVMIVAEALGEHEAKQEKALVGPSGFLLGRAFSRKRWSRDEFRYANSYWCKPARNQVRDPKGRLFPWAEEALTHCAPYLDQEIDTWKPRAIVALGETALYRLTGESFPITAARGYVFRERKDRCWVIPTYHPAFLLRGQEVLTQVLLWDVAKAKRIAAEGFEFDHPTCLLDPPVEEWNQFVQEALDTPGPLAVDIETPFKRSADEDDLGLEPVDVDMPFRVSFAFGPDKGASVAWSLPYLVGIRKLMTSGKMFIIWNRDFDRPRLEKALGISIPIEQTRDTMVAWHVLFNALPKKLGYATSCLPSSWRLPMWKHLNLTEGAYYSAMDAIALWRNDFDILALLEQTGQKVVFDNLITAIDPVLERMSLNGMLVDQQALGEFKIELEGLYASLTKEMTAVVPPKVRPLKVWKSERAALKGVELMALKGEVFDSLETLPGTKKESTCSMCGEHPVTATHVKRKTLKVPHANAPTETGTL